MEMLRLLFYISLYFINGISSLLRSDSDIIPINLDINCRKNKFITIKEGLRTLPLGAKLFTIHDYYSESHRIGNVMDGNIEIISDDLMLIFRNVVLLNKINNRIVINSKYMNSLNHNIKRITTILEKNPINGEYKEINLLSKNIDLNDTLILHEDIMKVAFDDMLTMFFTNESTSYSIIGNVYYKGQILSESDENIIKKIIEMKNINDYIEINIMTIYNDGIGNMKTYHCHNTNNTNCNIIRNDVKILY